MSKLMFSVPCPYRGLPTETRPSPGEGREPHGRCPECRSWRRLRGGELGAHRQWKSKAADKARRRAASKTA